MNHNLPDSDPSIHYNDSDYPSADHGRYPENLDATTEAQGVAHDVDRFLELAQEIGGPILEVGCGTGRVCIPLARSGHQVFAVDASAGMLALLLEKLAREPEDLVKRLTIQQADATTMELSRRDFDLAIIPFNTLQCIPDFDMQQAVLTRIGAHLRPGGRLLIDIMNPFRICVPGDPVPKLFFTRRNEWTGRSYSRFAMVGPLQADQRQQLHGWYDELRDDGTIERKPYSIIWRPIFRYELQLMLEKSGFDIEHIEGGHRGEPFGPTSAKMFVRAIHCGSADRLR